MTQFLNFKTLRASLDFRAVLAHYQVELHDKGKDQAMALCPLPTHQSKGDSTRSPSFSANLTRGIWQCFSCGLGGNLLEFGARMENLDPENGGEFRRAALLLDGLFNQGKMGGIAPKESQTPKPSKSTPKPHANTNETTPTTPEDAANEPAANSNPESQPTLINAPLAFALKDLDAKHPYLLERGFTEATIEHFGLGYCSRGMMSGRIAIPLHNAAGELIGYAGRVIDDSSINAETPRYRFPSARDHKGTRIEFQKSQFLYGGNLLTKPVQDLIVVEGFTALWWLWQHKYTQVAALMGSVCSETQAALLVQHTKPKGRIWLLSDGDSAGEKCTAQVLPLLAQHRAVRWLKLGDKQQPTDLSREALSALLP